MTETPELLHLRALRRDSYRCQHRDERGRPCLRRTGSTLVVDGEHTTRCGRHDGMAPPPVPPLP